MQTYQVNISGCPLKLKTEHDGATVDILKSEVELKIKDIQNRHSNISLQKALILACLHFAEGRFLLRKAVCEKLDHLEFQAQNVLKDMEPSTAPARSMEEK